MFLPPNLLSIPREERPIDDGAVILYSSWIYIAWTSDRYFAPLFDFWLIGVTYYSFLRYVKTETSWLLLKVVVGSGFFTALGWLLLPSYLLVVSPCVWKTLVRSWVFGETGLVYVFSPFESRSLNIALISDFLGCAARIEDFSISDSESPIYDYCSVVTLWPELFFPDFIVTASRISLG